MQQSRSERVKAELQEDQQQVLFKLQSDLLQTWSSLHVEEYYQNLVLNYLDTLPTTKVQQHITKEIKATNEGKSPYFKLSNNMSSRKQSLSALENLVRKSNKPSDVDSQSLTSICSLLSSLRDSNLLFAETLIQLLRQYSMNEDPVTDECMQMFQNLDEDNRFLKESFLKEFILFKEQYDPFFLYHYDMKGKMSPKKHSEIIDHLFTLSLSYVCRLLKANNQILEIVKEGKVNTIQKLESRLNSRRMSENLKLKRSNVEAQRPQEEKSTFTSNFRRKHFSLGNARQKMQESKPSFYKRAEKSSRKFINQDREEDNQDYLTSLDVKSKLQDNTLRKHLVTQSRERQQRRFIPQNFRIKPIHPKQPFNEEPSKSTITVEEDSPSSFKRKFVNIRNKLHPLKHFKKLYPETATNQEQSETNLSSKFSSLIKPAMIYNQSMKSSETIEPKIQDKESSYGGQNVKKQVKLRPGKYEIFQLLKLLKKLPFKKRCRQTINEPFQECLRKQQSYVSEFLLGEQVNILAISVVLSHQIYLIKLWGVVDGCSEQNSASLFKKYLDYLQKMTQLKQIHYSGDFIKEMEGHGFQKVQDNYYIRTRTNKPNIKIMEFQPFLSLKCSNIVIPQQNQQAKLLYSEDIEGFTGDNSFGSKEVIMIDKQKLNPDFKMLTKISEGIQNMKTLNTLLQDQSLDTFEVNSKSKITNIRALRLNFQTPFLTPFLSADGYLKCTGELTFSSEKSVICSVQCTKNNTKLHLGKGFKTLANFRENLPKKGKQECCFSIKMFSKVLYGRIQAPIVEGCYGYWQIDLSWQDELQGKTKHPMTNCEHFGPQSFFVAVQIEKQLVYCFLVDQKDFLL